MKKKRSMKGRVLKNRTVQQLKYIRKLFSVRKIAFFIDVNERHLWSLIGGKTGYAVERRTAIKVKKMYDLTKALAVGMKEVRRAVRQMT